MEIIAHNCTLKWNFLWAKVVDNAVKIYKGTISDVDSYSVFWDNKKLTQTTLGTKLSNLNATDIYVCGLAYDVCVGNTPQLLPH